MIGGWWLVGFASLDENVTSINARSNRTAPITNHQPLLLQRRQRQIRQMRVVVQNGLVGDDHFRRCAVVVARVEVAVIKREAGRTGNHPDFVSFLEHVAQGPQVEGVIRDFAGSEQHGLVEAIAEAGANDALA